jgi:hypothetical protein
MACGLLCVRALRARGRLEPGEDLRAWVLENLKYRDAKTRSYRFSTTFLLAGMVAYQGAVVIALLGI